MRISLTFLINSLIILILLFAITKKPAVSAGGLLSPRDQAIYKKAFTAAQKKNWSNAFNWASKAQNPLPAKVLNWIHHLKSGDESRFVEIATFLKANPNWPSTKKLIRRAEKIMKTRRISDQTALDWFAHYHPLTGSGQIRLAEALLSIGLKKEANQWLRYAWIHNKFSRRQSKQIYRDYHQTLAQADHEARLDKLLWFGHRYAAGRLYTLVSKGHRRLAEARESLMLQTPGVDGKIAIIPKALLANAGLIYERLRWRRRKGLDQRAQEILLSPISELGPRPEKWWLERHIQSRMALRENDADLAYRLASGHSQKAGGLPFAQAEWLAGWIALRHLANAKQALKHFIILYKNVRYPISLARAAYWIGRANSSLENHDKAKVWYKTAARHPATYYGQLASQAINRRFNWLSYKEPMPTAAAVVNFKKHELVRLSYMLTDLGQIKYLKSFLLNLALKAKHPSDRALVSRLSANLGQRSVAVRTAKISFRNGTFLAKTGYPIITNLPSTKVEPALIHAVVRQESEFNPRAISSASARGLMQLMPRTAHKTAKNLNVQFRPELLFSSHYNLRLGADHLNQMIKRYRGSYILALAAYNAGSKRVGHWLRQNGDPRGGAVDPIDWIELIPISETRNYVQRVIENLQVYRWRLKPNLAELNILQDLRR